MCEEQIARALALFFQHLDAHAQKSLKKARAKTLHTILERGRQIDTISYVINLQMIEYLLWN